jgi:hypothetical protein
MALESFERGEFNGVLNFRKKQVVFEFVEGC